MREPKETIQKSCVFLAVRTGTWASKKMQTELSQSGSWLEITLALDWETILLVLSELHSWYSGEEGTPLHEYEDFVFSEKVRNSDDCAELVRVWHFLCSYPHLRPAVEERMKELLQNPPAWQNTERVLRSIPPEILRN